MGNPFGLFENNAKPVVTVGVVSNTGISFVQRERNQDLIYKDMIQTDASISSGNSGGPLLNSMGEVIGMNTIIFTTTHSQSGDAGSIGIGFAIPINRVKRIVDLLKKDGRIQRNFDIGMKISEINERMARHYRLSRNEGILVTEVSNNSPASTAGIEPGDVITKINNRNTIKKDDLWIEIGDAVIGDRFDLELQRGNRNVKTKLTIPPPRSQRR
jgi:serine protease Do